MKLTKCAERGCGTLFNPDHIKCWSGIDSDGKPIFLCEDCWKKLKLIKKTNKTNDDWEDKETEDV